MPVSDSPKIAEAQPYRCPHLHRRHPYRFRHSAPLCLSCAVRFPPVLRRALALAAIIGSVLTLINQGDVLLAGKITPLVAMKIALTYTVPYLVSTYSALYANRSH